MRRRHARLARLRGPLGLDLGGAGIGETALSILAELVALDPGRTAQPLHAGYLAIRAEPSSRPGSDEPLTARHAVSVR